MPLRSRQSADYEHLHHGVAFLNFVQNRQSAKTESWAGHIFRPGGIVDNFGSETKLSGGGEFWN